MTIVTATLALADLRRMAASGFGDMVKGVVDVRREFLALDAELHADLEARLLAEGSGQDDLWGINLYPDLPGDEFIEFDSMINLRPSRGNRSRGVEDASLRHRIRAIVAGRIAR